MAYTHHRKPPTKRNFQYRDCEHVEALPILSPEQYRPLCDNERDDHIQHAVNDIGIDAAYLKFNGSWTSIIDMYRYVAKNVDAKRIIDSLGWSDFFELKLGNCCRGMTEAATRYWWDTTNSFLLLWVELGITPLDFTFLTGIPCGIGTEPLYDSSWETHYKDMIEIYFPNAKRRVPKFEDNRSNGIDNSKLRRYLKDAGDDPTTDVGEGREMARAFMMWLLGSVFFPNSGSVARASWVASLADMNRVGDYDLGSVILALLYHSLGESSRRVNKFEGFHMIIEFWLYASSSGAPVNQENDEDDKDE